MIRDILLILYFIFFMMAVLKLLFDYRKLKVINSFIVLQASVTLYYILIPLLVLCVLNFDTSNLTKALYRINLIDDLQFIKAFLYSVLFYIVMSLSYNISFFKKKNINYLVDDRSVSEFFRNEKKKQKIAVYSGLLCMTLGIFSLVLIIDSLGGIGNTIRMGDKLRAYGSNNELYIPSNRLFALTLLPIIISSLYFFIYSLRLKKNFFMKVLVLVSILGTTVYLALNAGRIAVLVLVITFFLDYAFRKIKHPFFFMMLLSVILLIMLGGLDKLFFYLSYGYVKEDQGGSLQSLINEFAYPYLNILNVSNINDSYGLRYGVDFFTWIINIIPSGILRIFGMSKIQTGYEYITNYYSTNGTSGGVPTDIITMGFRQFGFLGIVIVSSLLSRLSRGLDKYIFKVFNTRIYFIILRVTSIFFLIIPYADLDSFVRNRFDMIIVLLFLIAISKYDNQTEDMERNQVE